MPKRITLEQWKYRIHSINTHMHILNETLPQGTKEDPFICHCDDCGATFPNTKEAISTAYSCYKNNKKTNKWCPVCHGSMCITGINDIATTRQDLVVFFVDKTDCYNYTAYSQHESLCKCPNCGYERMRKISVLTTDGFSCPMCSDNISYPNKICRLLLEQLPVEDFEPEYIRKWTQGKKYDGYFKYDNQKFLLEFDGAQHYTRSEWTTYEQQHTIDKLKDKLAFENNYILIRINCMKSDFEFIKNNIISSELGNIFDLDLIDWNLLYEKSIKNYDFEIINYYMHNHDETYIDIGKKFHTTGDTISRILKKGADLGLSDYCQSDIKRNSLQYSINRYDNTYYFNVYDRNNNHIGRFCSSTECYNFMKTEYPDIIIPKSTIRKALFSGDIYKGFRFEYEVGLIEYHKNNKLLYDICKSYEEDRMLIKDICSLYSISKDAACKYLRAGNNMKICNYKPKIFQKTYWQQAC